MKTYKFDVGPILDKLDKVLKDWEEGDDTLYQYILSEFEHPKDIKKAMHVLTGEPRHASPVGLVIAFCNFDKELQEYTHQLYSSTLRTGKYRYEVRNLTFVQYTNNKYLLEKLTELDKEAQTLLNNFTPSKRY